MAFKVGDKVVTKAYALWLHNKAGPVEGAITEVRTEFDTPMLYEFKIALHGTDGLYHWGVRREDIKPVHLTIKQRISNDLLRSSS